MKNLFLFTLTFLSIGFFLYTNEPTHDHRVSHLPQEFKQVCRSPQIYVYEHFLSDEECDYLIEKSRPFLERATVIDLNSSESVIDESRTSLGVFLPSYIEDSTLKDILRRIAFITSIPEENGEDLQILYYGVGAEYRPHYDFFDSSSFGGRSHLSRGGQRVATLLMYLNTPEAGGETIFPRAFVKIVPEKGKAVLFYNTLSSGVDDTMSLHGGAPVIRGEKWLATRWLRESTFK